MTKKLHYIDLIAGAGGLSEGFKKAGFTALAHVEMDQASCFTLKTRACYYYLKEDRREEIYWQYIAGQISRQELYAQVPTRLLDKIINLPIGEDNKTIFGKIDLIKGHEEVDIIIGGPPCQAYSYIGRAALRNKAEKDKRNFLYKGYGEFLKKYKPRMFVFENVPGLKTAGGGRYTLII